MPYKTGMAGMGLIPNLCSEMGVAPELLARIVGLPADRISCWAVGGVPPHHHSDFRLLEELLEMVREWPMASTRTAIRVVLPALDGSSILDVLVEEGAVSVLERLRADVRVERPRAAPAEPSLASAPLTGSTRSVA